MAKPHTVGIAEDHVIVRDGLRAILASEEDLEIVCEAADGREAVECAEKHRPDLMLLDLSMPRMNGMEAIGEIKKVCNARVLVLTVHKNEEYVFEALRNGADGYVLKDAASSELLLGIRSVLAGHRYLSPQISSGVIEGFLETKTEQGDFRSPYDELSRREREVLKLIAEGYRSREIADYLCISPKTVEKHRSNLMKKLDLRSVQALTAYAMERGLVTR